MPETIFNHLKLQTYMSLYLTVNMNSSKSFANLLYILTYQIL